MDNENSASCGKTIKLHFKSGEHFMVFGYEVKALCLPFVTEISKFSLIPSDSL